MKGKIKLKFTVKQIAAGVTLLLGIILAIGYPTGGVKSKLNNNIRAQNKTVITNPSVKQTVGTKKTRKNKVAKKRIIKPITPANNNDDEGC